LPRDDPDDAAVDVEQVVDLAVARRYMTTSAVYRHTAGGEQVQVLATIL
jgi:hypothetical protein